jgi:hypothetical protein
MSRAVAEASIMGARMAMAGPTSMNIPRTRRMAFRAMRKIYLFPAK